MYIYYINYIISIWKYHIKYILIFFVYLESSNNCIIMAGIKQKNFEVVSSQTFNSLNKNRTTNTNNASYSKLIIDKQ